MPVFGYPVIKYEDNQCDEQFGYWPLIYESMMLRHDRTSLLKKIINRANLVDYH
jgi:hypothetical protein